MSITWADLRREYTCPTWLCGWSIQITGSHTDKDWALAVAQHTAAKCRKRVEHLGKLGAEIAAGLD